MPNRPVTRGDVIELAQQVGALQAEVHGLVGITTTAVKQAEAAQVQAKAAKKSADANPSRDELAATRRRFIRWGLIVVLVANLLGMGTTTAMITKCFLEVPQQGILKAACDAIPGYRHAEDENQKNLDKFQTLLGEIPKNKAENAHQQHDIDKIKRRLGIR